MMPPAKIAPKAVLYKNTRLEFALLQSSAFSSLVSHRPREDELLALLLLATDALARRQGIEPLHLRLLRLGVVHEVGALRIGRAIAREQDDLDRLPTRRMLVHAQIRVAHATDDVPDLHHETLLVAEGLVIGAEHFRAVRLPVREELRRALSVDSGLREPDVHTTALAIGLLDARDDDGHRLTHFGQAEAGERAEVQQAGNRRRGRELDQSGVGTRVALLGQMLHHLALGRLRPDGHGGGVALAIQELGDAPGIAMRIAIARGGRDEHVDHGADLHRRELLLERALDLLGRDEAAHAALHLHELGDALAGAELRHVHHPTDDAPFALGLASHQTTDDHRWMQMLSHGNVSIVG